MPNRPIGILLACLFAFALTAHAAPAGASDPINWDDSPGSNIDWKNPSSTDSINWNESPAAPVSPIGPAGETPHSNPAPAGNPGDRPAIDAALDAARRALHTHLPLPQSDAFPENLAPGQYRAFPTAPAEDGATFRAALYLPTYYDPSRKWPLLIEGAQRGRLPQIMRQMVPCAERHGFIFMVVEYQYFEGKIDRRVDVWTRRGTAKIQVTSRPLDEMLADMVADEKTVLQLLRTAKIHYAIDDKAVGMTGFLGASLMSYRLPLAYPGFFCATIARSGDFHTDFLPSRMGSGARTMPLTIVFGEKEEEVTLAASQRAADFFKRRKFTNLQVERIPNSGVDSRPEIAANCFRAAADRAIGQHEAHFSRLANRAGLLLDGNPAADDYILILAAPQNPGGDADLAAGASLQNAADDIRRQLRKFIDDNPRSPQAATAQLLIARLKIELLDQPQQGRADLEAFLTAPLLRHDCAPQALLYLVEHFHPPDQRPQQALKILNLLRRRKMSDAQQARLTNLIQTATNAS